MGMERRLATAPNLKRTTITLWCLSTCFIVAASFQGAQHHAILAPAHEYYVTPEHLGVFHTPLLGTMNIPPNLTLQNNVVTPANHSLNGTLHLFLRAVNDSQHRRILLRGLAYWDPAGKPMLWADLKIATPYEFNKWTPTMTLRLNSHMAHSRKQHPLQVVRAPDDTKPLSIFGEIPAHAADMYVGCAVLFKWLCA